LSFSVANYFVNENVVGSNALITVTRSGGAIGNVTVNYATADGSATAGVRYFATSGTLLFTNAQTSATFPVTIINDSQVNGNQTVQLFLSNPTGPATLGLSAATLTIIDDDFSPGTLVFSTANYSVSESAGFATITLLRTNGNTGVVNVQYATANGTASGYSGAGPTTGFDYTNTSGTLSFGDGVTNLTFQVGIIGDTTVEGNETVILSLTSPTGGAVLGSPSVAVLAIIDDDFAGGTLSFVPAATNVVENVASGVVTNIVKRLNGSSGNISVTASTVDGTALAGRNYTTTTTNLSWLSGDS